ncbi:VWA domain-containing protein [Motilimonas sp. 1_MG-2023]|uniref:vWA domain-containing protein n=1 Tax=Motilimonas sp. 1_MG-2023 TaxID=3062672 RepID=UPI0026E30935|nr:VWA domain-containing protein [Motilimonas sp. 1_MG-2023]MDO6524662.1 VWA domain-containing protein [Motilimonas sp. 1_MG-2023]
MFEFSYLWLALLLPLPLLLLLLKPLARQQLSLWLPLAPISEQQTTVNVQTKLPQLLLWLAWLFFVLALMRPTWVGEPIRITQQHRDVMLALDLSRSMEIEDMELGISQVNRLAVSKKVISDFISRRSGDRLGLILFADHAYLQAPLTFDLATLQTLMQETEIGLVGDKTAIGEGIGLAVKRFIEAENEQRVLILLTDGQNTSGSLTPQQAGELAKQQNIKIYTIGLGADVMIQRNLFGSHKVNPSADLDEKTLSDIATMTGGQYFRARSSEDLEQIYQTLDQLEPIANEEQSFRPEKNLFFWPLLLSLILFSCRLVLVKERN